MTAFFPVRVWKEVRGLSAAWLACAVSIALGAVVGDRMKALSLVGYGLGAVALGGLSIGQEFDGRTLGFLLSQPISRARLFSLKSGVLGTMLLVLAGMNVIVLGDSSSSGLSPQWWALSIGLPLLCGFFLAPALTLVCRSTLAGIVFAIAVPAITWLACEFATVATYGGELSALVEAQDFTIYLFWRAMILLSIAAAVAAWLMFMRIEAIDSGGIDMHLPSWMSRADAAYSAPRSAWKLLALKEIHLQQLTFAVSVLYVTGWIAIAVFRLAPATVSTSMLLMAITAVHAMTVALLAGSLASAEERRMGTLGWQMLLPMAGWKQWLLKAAAVVSLSLVLALALPSVLLALTPLADTDSSIRSFFTPGVAIVLLATTIVSLYVSSLSANGLRAILVSVPVVIGIGGLARLSAASVQYRLGPFGGPFLSPSAFVAELLGPREHLLRAAWIAIVLVAAIGIPALILRFSLTNHRSAERGAGRVWKQFSAIAAVLVVFGIAGTRVSSAYSDGVMRAYELRQRTTGTRVLFHVDAAGAADPKDVTVLVFTPGGGWFRVTSSRNGEFLFNFGARKTDGALSAIAVGKATLSQLNRDYSRRDTRLRERLLERATPLIIKNDELVTVDLQLTVVQ